MAYNHVHQNMPDALPCLRTMQENINAEYYWLSEGQFRFDELASYLKKFDAPLVIAVSEDATRVISRVEYDNETNRLVGFLFPCDSNGLPVAHYFLALSLESVEECFKTQEISKFAYVFMAQCITQRIHAICVGCIGSSNCFDATDVLQRWQYIFSECQTCNISFGSDGDSRLLWAMKISCNFNLKSSDACQFHFCHPPFWWMKCQIPNNGLGFGFKRQMLYYISKILWT